MRINIELLQQRAVRPPHHLEICPVETNRLQFGQEAPSPTVVLRQRRRKLFRWKNPSIGAGIERHGSPLVDRSEQPIRERCESHRPRRLWRVHVATVNALPDIRVICSANAVCGPCGGSLVGRAVLPATPSQFGSACPSRLRRANIRLARRQRAMRRFVSGTTQACLFKACVLIDGTGPLERPARLQVAGRAIAARPRIVDRPAVRQTGGLRL
jgi:hypothetical protein